MRIRALFSTVIQLLNDDDLFASLAALEDDGNLRYISINDMPLEKGGKSTFPGL
jgi:hypothetical protein